MGEITTVGLDLAKSVFHLIGCDAHGKEVKRKMLRRGELLAYIARLPPCLIGRKPVPAPTTGHGDSMSRQQGSVDSAAACQSIRPRQQERL